MSSETNAQAGSFYRKATLRAKGFQLMIVKSKTEITVETHRVLRVNSRGQYLLAWCDKCGEETQVVTEAEAAILTGILTRAVSLPVRTAEPHILQTPDGLVVCLNSVMK